MNKQNFLYILNYYCIIFYNLSNQNSQNNQNYKITNI